MKIAVFEVEDWERGAFQSLQDRHDLVFSNETLTARNVVDYTDVDIVSTFIYSDLSKHVLEQFDHLELVATRSTGFDHIDTAYCQERGIMVSNVPTYGDNTVAEHVFALLLSISHKMIDAVDRTRRGDFSLQGLRGFDLEGKRLGVVGTGSIGQCVIRIANGFGMDIVAFDVRQNEELTRRFGFRYVSMDELLSTSDIITLHVPSNPKTYHMLSEEQFSQMKDGVVLINTARGDLIDVRSLVQALGRGKVSAAGLDVLPDEPTIHEEAELLRSGYRERHELEELLAGHMLLRMRNVVITPHSAFNTNEAVQRILDTTVDNIQAFVRGKPQHVVVQVPLRQRA